MLCSSIGLLKDITGNVQLDPQYPHPIDREVGREVYRGLYTWTNPDTPQVFSRNATNTFTDITADPVMFEREVVMRQLPVVSAGVEQRQLEQADLLHFQAGPQCTDA